MTFVDEFYPDSDQLALLEAAQENLTETQRMKQAELAMLALTEIPRASCAAAASSTLKRPEILTEARGAQSAGNTFVIMPNSKVLQDILNGLLRGVNGLHQGDKNPPPISGFGFKMQRDRASGLQRL